jgi:Tol biopolymer transport system component
LYNVRAAGIPRFAAGKLYIVPPSGGPPRQIQATAKSATYGIWSPDSDRLLTVGSFEKGIEADEWWVAPLEGPAVQVRLDPLNDQGLGRPYTSSYVVYPTAWLPGNRIVFSAFSGDSRNSWTVTLSPKTWQIDGPAQRLTSGAGIEGATSVTFAGPDMLRLAFANIAENIDLWSAPLDHAGMPADQLVRLTDDAFPDAVPTLTADGRTLVFASARQGPWELWARDLTSKRETKLVSMAPDWLFKPVLSSDGSRLAFWRQDNDGRPAAAFVTDLAASSDGTLHTGNMRELPALAKEGAGWPWSWTPDGKALWYDTVRWPRLGPNHLYDVATGQAVAEFVHPQHDLTNLLVSPDSRWLLFTEVLSESVERLVVTPMKDGRPAGERDWIPLTGGDTSVYWPAWSVSGDAVYFTSDRDGFVCVWKQRVSGGMRLLGEPVAIHHAHSARLSIAGVGHNRRGLAAARDKVVFNMSEIAGNIWMAELQDRP